MAKMQYTKSQQERLNQAEAELEALKQRKANLEQLIDNLQQEGEQVIVSHKMESRQGRPPTGKINEKLRQRQTEWNHCSANMEIQQRIIEQLPAQFAKENRTQAEIDQRIPELLQALHDCAVHLQKGVKGYYRGCQIEREIQESAKALPRHLIRTPRRFMEWPVDRVHPNLIQEYGQRLEAWLGVESRYHNVKLEPDAELQKDREADEILDQRIREDRIKSAKRNEERKELIQKFEKTKSGRTLARAKREAQRQHEDNLNKVGLTDERTRRSDALLQDARRAYDRGLEQYQKVNRKKKRKKKKQKK